MPSQNRRRLNHAGEIEQVRPQARYSHQLRTIAALQWHAQRPSPHRDVELMPEKEIFGLKPAPRLEQIGDKGCNQAEDRKHRTR